MAKSIKRWSIVDYRKLGSNFYYIFKSDKINWGKNSIFFCVFKWEHFLYMNIYGNYLNWTYTSIWDAVFDKKVIILSTTFIWAFINQMYANKINHYFTFCCYISFLNICKQCTILLIISLKRKFYYSCAVIKVLILYVCIV